MQLAVLNLGANRRRGQESRDLLPVDQGCLISRGVSRTTRGARGQGQVMVGGAWGAGLVEADLVEPGEPVVAAGQHGVVLDDADVGEHLDVGGSPLALEPYIHRLPGAQIAYHPNGRRPDEQGPFPVEGETPVATQQG